jgi:hypothetical protein
VEGGDDDRLLLSFASLVDSCERKKVVNPESVRRKNGRKRTGTGIDVDACESAGRRFSSQNVAETGERKERTLSAVEKRLTVEVADTVVEGRAGGESPAAFTLSLAEDSVSVEASGKGKTRRDDKRKG